MFNFPIIDAHLHLWDNHHLNYSWLQATPALNKPHMLRELSLAIQSCPIESVVFVQAECDTGQSLAEVNWVSGLAHEDTRIKAIVAHASLENGEAMRSHLAILKKNSLVKGVRRLLQSEANDFCLQPDFVKGVQMLAEFDFTFDVCIKWHQLPQVIRLVKQCPHIKFVLDHIGKPNIAEQQTYPWQDNLGELAQFQNVWCKISGVVTEADHQAWQKTDIALYIQHAVDVFGFDRLMFGSDWPVMNLATNYKSWLNTVYDLLKQYSEENLIRFFSKNALDFYGFL